MTRKSFAIAFTLIVCLAVSAHGQHGYTDFGEFWDDTSRLNVRYVINFDDLSPGANASVLGITEIGAEGLLSDGSSRERLTPIAANVYTPYSTPNSLGAYRDNQFLAGNSDMVIFSFARPVFAFGLFLIGNPSPTGDPPIPFWRMRINLPVPEVFSATEPFSTLGPGNDVYFLGILSEEPFTEVQLFSDNDEAAVFSFDIDNVIWCTEAKAATLAEAKALPSGADILVSDVLVTRVHQVRFNVERKDRSIGMAVLGLGTVRDTAVSLFGTIGTTPDNERVINLLQILSQDLVGAPRALGMSTRFVGGGAPNGLQTGCAGSTGPNNIGLDVSITGRVTGMAADLSWIAVDDGAGRGSGIGPTGVRVVGAIGDRYEGELVEVTGSVSLFSSAAGYYPMIRVASEKDIVHIEER